MSFFLRKFRELEPSESWMSYADLLTSLVMVFLLVLAATLYDGQQKLKLQQKQLSEEARELSAQRARNRALERRYQDLHERVRQTLSIRARIVERLRAHFLDSEAAITFDPKTGSIQLGGEMLFAEGSAVLQEDARRTLDEIMPKYFDALFRNDADARYIKQIVIEGHANSNSGDLGPREGYLFNLKLSQERARAAMAYIVALERNTSFTRLDLLSANGCSNIRPIMRDGLEDEVLSRRIEIRFELRDEQALTELEKLTELDAIQSNHTP